MGPRLVGRGRGLGELRATWMIGGSFNGAAAGWPRKVCHEAARWEVGRMSASMGPRLVGRGRQAARRDVADLLTMASMGPRLVGRGRHAERTTCIRGRKCFNGAAAGWPRKGDDSSCKSVIRMNCSQAGFNGAAAGWPRKGDYGRGGLHAGGRWAADRRLQWGRGWLAAEGAPRSFATQIWTK
jgi:hypothetical protein